MELFLTVQITRGTIVNWYHQTHESWSWPVPLQYYCSSMNHVVYHISHLVVIDQVQPFRGLPSTVVWVSQFGLPNTEKFNYRLGICTGIHFRAWHLPPSPLFLHNLFHLRRGWGGPFDIIAWVKDSTALRSMTLFDSTGKCITVICV